MLFNLFAGIGHDNVQKPVVLAAIWVEDLAFFRLDNLCLALSQELKEWNLAGTEEELRFSIKNINRQISLLEISAEPLSLVFNLAQTRVHIEAAADDVVSTV